MTFAELQAAVLQARFKDAQRAEVKRWIRAVYAEAWALAAWPWKVLPDPLSVTVSSGTQVDGIDLTGLQRVTSVQVVRGSSVYELEIVDEERFRSIHLPRQEASTTGPIDTVCVVASYSSADGYSTLRVSPLPDADTTLYVSGYLRPWVFDSDGNRQARTLERDGDLPAWMPDHHEFLVPGAISYGLREENDPTWPELRALYDQGLSALLGDAFPSVKLAYGSHGRR